MPLTTLGFGAHLGILLIGIMIQGNILGIFAELIHEMHEVNIMSQAQADATVSAMT